jgi:hypothetical protein
MKMRKVGAELFHADGQTDRHDKANSRVISGFCHAVDENCALLGYYNSSLRNNPEEPIVALLNISDKPKKS